MSNLLNSSADAPAGTKRALLAERLRQVAEEPPAIPLSFAQQRLWFIDQLEPNTPLYNVPTVVQMSGTLNAAALQQALDAVVARHETLRTKFVCADGNPAQVVDENASVKIAVQDLSHLPEGKRKAAAQSLVREEVNLPFDLSRAPLLRATLLRLRPDEHWFILNMHHIVSDEWSLKVCFRELTEAYEAFSRGRTPGLSELPIQYADYTLWQRDWAQAEILEEQLRYWQEQLKDNPPVLELPTDGPRPPMPTFRGCTQSHPLPKRLAAALQQIATQHEATLFMVLLAAFKTLLGRWTQQEDIVVGSPIAGRNQMETEGLIGFFVNTLVLRTDASGDPKFTELLRRVRETTLGAYAHQDLPFEKLVEKLHPERTLTHMPFTHVMFAVQNGILEELNWPDLTLRFVEPESDTAKFDVTLVVQTTSDGLIAQAEYNRDLFTADSIGRLLQHFETLLEGIVANPEQRLSELPLLSEAERRQLVEWSNTATAYPRSRCIHTLFEAQAERAPNAVAVTFEGQSVTYRELNERANQLARYLKNYSVGPNVLVGICTQRSVEMVTGMLAILKAGGAYVPLDLAYPKERMAFMLADAGAQVLLTQQQLLSRLPKNAKVICLDSDWELIARESRANLSTATTPEDLAYVIYTSGSTGQPKGVAVPHRAVNRLVLNTDYVQLGAADRVAQVSNASFDAATFEVWGALLNGARLVGIETDVALSPKDFSRRLSEENVSALFLTTALFNQVASEAPGAFATVRTVMFGGEAVDPKWVKSVLEHEPPQRLLHVYGPTENTTFSTWHLVQEVPGEANTVPIGRPIANTRCYVLDRHMRPVPIGVPGDLYLGGDGLARGYWNRPELTEQKFVPDPFGGAQSSSSARTLPDAEPRGAGAPRSDLLYKTGDLVRWRPDGALEFLGRIDHQVKVRGFRIELGEIEAVLSRHAAIRECVVMLRDNRGGNKQLAAYFVPSGRRLPSATELRRFLQEKLPDYMVPAAFVQLEALPLTPNGKVDRRALPEPDKARPKLEKSYATPTDAVEVKLTEIWENVLGVHPIGIEDKFFELGGHSLLAVRLVAQIEKAFGRKLRLATIFQAPTIEQLAAIIREEIQEGTAIAGTSLVEIQSQGTRAPLFFVHGAGGGMFWGYVNLSRCLGTDQPIYGLKSRGLDGREEFSTIEEMAAQYVADLRALQPRGPYYLGGFCFGGNVAFEMARRLQAEGEAVAMLALLNSAPPNSSYMKPSLTPRWLLRFGKNLFYWLNYFSHWSPTHRREFLRWKKEALKRRVANFLGGRGDDALSRVDAGNLVDLSSYPADQRRLWETHIHALLNYHPKPYRGRVHLFRSPGHPLLCSFDEAYGWGELVQGGVNVRIVPGVHERILEEPCVQTLAKEMNGMLSEIAKNARPAGQAFSRDGGTSSGDTSFREANVSSRETDSRRAWEAISVAGRNTGLENPVNRQTGMSALQDDGQRQLTDWNNTRADFPLDKVYARHFEAQVERTPQAIAVRFQKEELTYAELNERANRLAHQLKSLGIGPETLVGICLDRSPDLLVALLAVFKAGGAYLPLDRSYPAERLAYMLSDSQARVLLTMAGFVSDLKADNVTVVCLDDPERAKQIRNAPPTNPECSATPDNLAYVIYTSGSTGMPKGVQITQRSLLNHNFGTARAYRLQAKDRVLQFSPFSFDISVEEIFPSLLRGCTIVLRTDEVLSSTARFIEFVGQEQLTVLNLPTAYWHEIVDYLQAGPMPSSIRLVVIGGEKASDEAWRRWKARVGRAVTLINSYGPTETTVIATMHIGRPDDESLPIGRPIANVQTYVLDADLQPVPAGVTGELHIGGIGVSRGYLNRPELTAEKFIPNPFADRSNFKPEQTEKTGFKQEQAEEAEMGNKDKSSFTSATSCSKNLLYKTGDLARFRPDGELEFVGRVDEQVKIRGFRIELGEIETALQAHPALKEAVVVAREDEPGKKKLVAYLVPRGPQAPGVSELLNFLKGKLPPYMVPSAFVRLDVLPMTPAGKVDRRSLPAPSDQRPELDQQFVAARTPVEEVICNIWREVLDLNRVGVHDNFFDLGGHSLLATQVISRMREELQVEVPLANLFAYPTVSTLAEHLVEASPESQPILPSSSVSKGTQLPLTAGQWRTWFLDQFEPGLANYNIPTLLRLTGPLDRTALERSLTELSHRHEVLRAVFPVEDGQSLQIICEPREVKLPVMDLAGLPEAEREGRALEFAAREGAKPYIMSRPVLRPRLLRLSDDQHFLLIITHQVACDSWSVRLMLNELAAIYDSFANGRPVSLAPLPIRYGDAIASLQVSPEKEQAQLNYWLERLQGAPALLDLPADRPRPAHQKDEGARQAIFLSRGMTDALDALSREEGCTPFELLLAVFQTLLSRYTGNNDIVVGSTVCMRPRPELERLIGKFDNIVVLRTDLSGDPGFSELLARVRDVNRGALANSALLFEHLLKELAPARNASYTPIFQVMFDYFDEPAPVREAGGLRLLPAGVHNGTCKFDLKLSLARTPEGLSGWVEYSTALFDHDRMSRLINHFTTLLSGVVENPEQRLSSLPLLSKEERQQVLLDWNATERPYPQAATLTQLFEAQVERTPDAFALVAGTERLSYRELNARANQLARHLQSLGVKPGVLVGICLERSWRLLVGILGVLKAGGAYVPLDPAYPKDRLGLIVQDAKAPVLLTQESLRELCSAPGSAGVPPAGRLEAGGPRIVCLDSDWHRIRGYSRGNSPGVIESSDLAYVIYTSGSTGVPKGVALEHRNAVALVCWAKDVFAAEELAGVLASTSICFDLSIFEMFVPLSWGGKVILAENALALPGLPAANEVTLINTVPSAIRELLRVKGVPPSVRVVNLAGEPLATAIVNHIYSETRAQKVYDLYGPTETTTYSTFTLRKPDKPATIGRPLANEQVYLLDAHQQPVPIGVPGELYIGGAGVARGYLNRPELTAEKFVRNPFGAQSSMLYRTGDLARWRADGNLEFLGRIDHQVKIRGFRIELGEVESALRKHPGLREVVVIASQDEAGNKRLVAYVVNRPGQQITTDDLRHFLKEHLPEYMVPSAFVFLDELPLTPNGKVDRKALPEPDRDRDTAVVFVEPQTPVEQQLAAIWREVLELDRVGIRDNFFELGGHSLLAIQVISRVRETLKVELPLFSLFDAPTIELLGKGLATGEWTQNQLPVLPLQPVSRDGKLPASLMQEGLWFIEQLNPTDCAYNVPSLLRLKGKLEVAQLQRALDEIVARHEPLRTTFGFTNNDLYLQIQPPAPVEIQITDLRNRPREGREAEAGRLVQADAERPFDLSRGPLIRFHLVQLDDQEYLFVVVLHHTICDGCSIAIFFYELEELYNASVTGQRAALPELPVQFPDFVQWQREWMQGPALKPELDFWKNHLAGAPCSTALPADYPEPANPTRRSGVRTLELSPELVGAITAQMRSEGCTPFMVLMAALALVLKKWTGQDDLVIGTVVAGRNRREIENVIGCFINFLPIRVKFAGPDGTGRNLLKQVKTAVLDAQAHQDCPFEKMVKTINPDRRVVNNPLYNVTLLFQNFERISFEPVGMTAEFIPLRPEASPVDLMFEAEAIDRGISVRCEFRTDLFDPATIETLLASYQAILEKLVRVPETALSGFTPAAELEAQARLARGRDKKDTIAVTATFTAEPVKEPLEYWMKELEIPAAIEFAPFNQVFQQLLDPTSAIAANLRGLNVVLVRPEDWQESETDEAVAADVKRRTSEDASQDPPPYVGGYDKSDELERTAREFVSAMKSAAARTSTPFLVMICPASGAVASDPERRRTIGRLEESMAAELDKLSGVHVVTPRELLELYPVSDYNDASGDELGRVPYTPVFFTALGTMIARKLHALRRAPHKVIVLDCDQTLWSGVCGEDGARGICLDDPRKALQEFMRAQHGAGRLLAVCSKNNEDDVRDVFAQRLDMPLRREHIAAWRTNWVSKSENLKSLAAELNLGLDSFIFVDDNPVECAGVEANCPDVLVLQLPEDPAQIPQFLKHCWAFDHSKLTAEDRRRTELYHENRQRADLRSESMSLGDFLAGLQLQIEIEPLSAEQLPRVAQLTQRTNQFNCTTIRRTETEIQQLSGWDEMIGEAPSRSHNDGADARSSHRPGGSEILTVSVRDRFGDYGLVGVVIGETRGELLEVETFLLSCRVLGRGVEHEVLAHLGKLALERKLRWVDVQFHPSPKNKPAADFLQSVGADFKQPQNGGFIYRFPAEYAAEVVFHPQEEEGRARLSERAGADPVERSGALGETRPTSAPKFIRCRAIAIEANDAAKIHRAMEARTTLRSGKQAGYETPRSELEKQLCELWEKLLHIERVGITDNFFELGGHSLLAVRFFAELEKLTGRKLPLVTLFQAPTVEELARVLEGKDGQLHSTLVPVQANGSRPPLFLVHGAGGDVLWGYANLARHTHPDQPIYGIKSRGQVGLEEYDKLEDMARFYLEEIRAFQPHGPYYLGGYCFGGNIAYEMARQLRAQGERVALLALIDASPANAGYEDVAWWRPTFAVNFARNFSYWLEDFAELKPEERRRFVGRKMRALGRKVAGWFRKRKGPLDVDLEDVIDLSHFPANELKFWQIHLRALVNHVEQPYDGAVTLIRTRGQPLWCSLEDDFCWSRLARGGVRIQHIPGSHENIFMEPNVRFLAEQLETCLADARQSADKTSSECV